MAERLAAADAATFARGEAYAETDPATLDIQGPGRVLDMAHQHLKECMLCSHGVRDVWLFVENKAGREESDCRSVVGARFKAPPIHPWMIEPQSRERATIKI
jgi:hypothetical protein